MKMEALDRLIFYQNYRQRYTVIPITTVRGPSLIKSDQCGVGCSPDQRIS